MGIPNRAIAKTQSATLALANLHKQVACRATPRKDLMGGCQTCFWFPLEPTGGLSYRAESAPLYLSATTQLAPPSKEYARIRDFRALGSADKADFRIIWGNWHPLIERFNLDDALP